MFKNLFLGSFINPLKIGETLYPVDNRRNLFDHKDTTPIKVLEIRGKHVKVQFGQWVNLHNVWKIDTLVWAYKRK